ncbi:MAG TPA: DNA polymerase III subunit gamma/tau, partial [Spirochaetales bacterium]|nr:DNA polymerase III subunit gamma/tau [Spirochaetales bacterium]
HAYLFSGPRGCGKTSTARILAKSLNCEGGPTSKPCGKCASCQSIQRGAALDVIEIDGASNTSVDNVRQIKDEVLFPPSSGRYKVYIIDEVHMLSNSAFNALLKTIEEPPPYIVFIFATTELHKVPATIKSRCQQFNFRLIPLDVIRERLREAATELAVDADEEALLWIAKEATGSLRDAYTLFDQAVSFSEGRITYEKVRDKLGLVGVDRMNDLFERCVRGERSEALDWVEDILSRGVSPEQCVADAAEYLRSLLLIKSGVSRESVLGDSPSRYSPEVLEALSSQRIERALAEILDLHRDLRYTVDPRLELELAAARLCSIRDWISPSEAARAVEELRAWTLSADAASAPALPGQKKNREPALSPDPREPSEGPRAVRPARGTAAQGRLRDSGEADPGELSGSSDPGDAEAAGSGAGPSAGRTAPSSEPGSDARAVREAVLARLAKSHVVLASALDKSLSWTVTENRLEILFRSGYEEAMARRDLAVLVKAAGEAAGRVLKVELRVEEAPKEAPRTSRTAAEDDLPPPDEEEPETDAVEIVERVFRGKRVEGSAPPPRSGEADGYF